MQLWSMCPAVAVAVSGMLIIQLVVCSVLMSITGLSADKSSSAPALADSGGIFFLEFFMAIGGWDPWNMETE